MKKSIRCAFLWLGFLLTANATDEPKELVQARTTYEARIKTANEPIKRVYIQQLEQLKKSFGAKGDTDAINAITAVQDKFQDGFIRLNPASI